MADFVVAIQEHPTLSAKKAVSDDADMLSLYAPPTDPARSATATRPRTRAVLPPPSLPMSRGVQISPAPGERSARVGLATMNGLANGLLAELINASTPTSSRAKWLNCLFSAEAR